MRVKAGSWAWGSCPLVFIRVDYQIKSSDWAVAAQLTAWSLSSPELWTNYFHLGLGTRRGAHLFQDPVPLILILQRKLPL